MFDAAKQARHLKSLSNRCYMLAVTVNRGSVAARAGAAIRRGACTEHHLAILAGPGLLQPAGGARY